jgi:alkylated DNA repair protein alkB homolog 1
MTPATTFLTDTSSPAYKKAQRQYLKSTNNRSKDVELHWTPFRAAEKKYKARFPPPDLSDVLDVATLDNTRAAEVAHGGWCGSADAVDCKEIKLKMQSSQKAYAVPSIPGATKTHFTQMYVFMFVIFYRHNRICRTPILCVRTRSEASYSLGFV